MKICKNAIEGIQTINDDGDVRICGWQKDGGVIGRLTKNSMEEIYNGTAARLIMKRHLEEDYSNCNPNACPFLASEDWSSMLVDIDELPRLPETLRMAHENVCNYHCGMCTIPGCVGPENWEEHEKKMDIIDDEIRKILPYVKHISANGLGELFASKHILQLLSEWEPVAKKEECTVSLESNGSLFNEKNWEKIKNLGNYYLEVAITVLSFDNDIYQELSGTKLPISNIENNLRFIKRLKDEGVINYLTIATVYQEKNFRELPEFARRCIEEFGADYVRLRPFEPWRDPDFADWYRDVRNEYHPLHKDFLEVMKHPYLKNPKIHDWGAGKASGLGPEPYPRTIKQFNMISKMLEDGTIDKIKEKIPTKKVAVYAMHTPGRAVASFLANYFDFEFGIDKRQSGQQFLGKPIYNPNELAPVDDVTIVVSLERYEDSIVEFLHQVGYSNVITIKELVDGE